MDILHTARRVLEIEAGAVRALIPRLDETFVRAVEMLQGCRGRVVLTGMGKSGFIAKKIAATLASTGTPALFLHPAEGVHGDLGMVVRGDVVVVVSNSGETEEIVELLPAFKRLGVSLIALVGNLRSTLARQSDVVLDVGVAEEACPMNLAPTASTTAALAMGDALAVAAVLSVSPGLLRPSPLSWEEMGLWMGNAWHGLTTVDPSGTILDKPAIGNLSLRPALARFFQRYPAGHPLSVDHPGFFQFLDLSPQAAGFLVRSLMLAFIGLVAWRFRRPASDDGDPVVLPLELATVSALALLYSPITWKQHCVSLLPALFLLTCCSLQWDRVSRWMWSAMTYYVVFALVLARDAVGRQFSILLESYHVVTWAILLVVILLLAWHRRMLASGWARYD